MFYFVNWRETEEGKIADLPEEVDYMMLAEPSSVSDYALFECVVPDEHEDSESVESVSDYLHDLLESSKDYPPALALTRKEVLSNRVVSKSEFSAQLVERLEFHLQHQRISPYFLARKINRHIQWKSKGGFRWIIGYNPQTESENIVFVSNDYYVCRASIEDFEIEVAEIERRFAE